MIVLFDKSATTFTSNGLGVLPAVFCDVREEINGEFSLSIELSADAAGQLVEGAIIRADTHRGPQPFRVYRVEKHLDGNVGAYALHISYDLLGAMIVNRAPTNTTAVEALSVALEGTRFTGTSDIVNLNSVRWVMKNPIQAIVGDEDNSIVNRWGGEVERDGYTLNVWQRLGADRGVSIRYRKNLTGLDATTDVSGVVTRIYPTGLQEDGNTVLQLPELYIDSQYAAQYPTIRAKHIHYGDIQVGNDEYPDEGAAIEALRGAVAAEYAAGVDLPLVSMAVGFVDLTQTIEYKNFQVLERVHFGDTVRCYHDGLGIDVVLRVTAVQWDAATGRYAQITLGQIQHGITQEIQQQAAKLPEIEARQSELAAAIIVAQSLLMSPGSSYIQHIPSIASPSEIVAMDTQDINTAMKVVRINAQGIGISQTGYAGPYTIIADGGGLYASAILAGTIGADVLFAGVLEAARGSFVALTAGLVGAQRIDMGTNEYNDPYLDMYDNQGNLTLGLRKDALQQGNFQWRPTQRGGYALYRM